MRSTIARLKHHPRLASTLTATLLAGCGAGNHTNGDGANPNGTTPNNGTSGTPTPVVAPPATAVQPTPTPATVSSSPTGASPAGSTINGNEANGGTATGGTATGGTGTGTGTGTGGSGTAIVDNTVSVVIVVNPMTGAVTQAPPGSVAPAPVPAGPTPAPATTPSPAPSPSPSQAPSPSPPATATVTWYLPKVNKGERLMTCRSQRYGIGFGTLSADGQTLSRTGFEPRSPGQREQALLGSRLGGTLVQATQPAFDAVVPVIATDQRWQTRYDDAASRSGTWVEQRDAKGVLVSIHGTDQYSQAYRCVRTNVSFLPAPYDGLQFSLSFGYSTRDLPPALYTCRIGDPAYGNYAPAPQVLAWAYDLSATLGRSAKSLLRQDSGQSLALPASVQVGAASMTGTIDGRPFDCTRFDQRTN